jgi:hypothetical protein
LAFSKLRVKVKDFVYPAKATSVLFSSWGLLDIPTGQQTYKCDTKAHRQFFEFLCLTRNMCLIIADNLNVRSFSLKPVIFGKKAIFGQTWPFSENLLYLNKGKK